MAVARNPIICPHCGESNPFQYNKLSLKQKLAGFIGDTGGVYPTVCKKCNEPFIKLIPMKLTKKQKEFLKNLGK